MTSFPSTTIGISANLYGDDHIETSEIFSFTISVIPTFFSSCSSNDQGHSREVGVATRQMAMLVLTTSKLSTK